MTEFSINGRTYTYVDRDVNGKLFAYNRKPVKDIHGRWVYAKSVVAIRGENQNNRYENNGYEYDFSGVNWTDEEPTLIEDYLIGKIENSNLNTQEEDKPMSNLNRIEALEKKVSDLLEELTALKEEETKTQSVFPEEGDTYYYINESVQVDEHEWNNGWGPDVDRKAVGNVFQTKEKAEHEIERLKTLQILKDYARPYEDYGHNMVIEFDNDYDNDYDIITVDTDIRTLNTLYFDSYATVEKALDEAGRDNVVRYIFGVEP